MTTGKTIALTRRTFVGKVMSLLLNMLSAAAAAKLLQSCPTLPSPHPHSMNNLKQALGCLGPAARLQEPIASWF